MTLPDGMLPVPYPYRSLFSLPSWVLAMPPQQWQALPITVVPLERIVATKSAVLQGALESALSAVQQSCWDRSLPFGEPCLPLGFADEDGAVALTDGHHRAVAARLSGHNAMPVRVAGPLRPHVIVLDPSTPFVAGVLAAQRLLRQPGT
jgi:hypothetical protein